MISLHVQTRVRFFSLGGTYPNCCEDILQFVNKSNELRVVDIDPACSISLGRSFQGLRMLTSSQRARPW